MRSVLWILLLGFVLVLTGCDESSEKMPWGEICTSENYGSVCTWRGECQFDSLDAKEGVCVALTKCSSRADCDGRDCNENRLDGKMYCGTADIPFGIDAPLFPSGQINVAYPEQILSVVGSSQYQLTCSEPCVLPAGMSFENGTISGTPTEMGVFTFTITAINGLKDATQFYGNRKVVKTYQISIAGEGYQDPCITNPCTGTNKTVCTDTDKDEVAECSCDSGFHADGESCVSSTKELPCKDLTTVPENGEQVTENITVTWDETNGWPEASDCGWQCKEGFTKVDETCIQYVDPCGETNPCTDPNKTVCTDEDQDGTAECGCDDGYTLVGDVCTQYVDPCITNPCTDPNKTVCTDDNQDGTAECGCDAGYELVGDTCKEIVVEATLFFSEYIEGSSNNKVLELYNPLTTSADLSTYSIALASNGNEWGDTDLQLEGTLAGEKTYVICHSSIAEELKSKCDLLTGAGTGFNGNDAVGLKHNGTLIDVIGVPTANIDQAVAGVAAATKNHTLIRKTSIKNGTTDWALSAGTNETDSQWIVKDIDYFDNVGLHGDVVVMLCDTDNGGCDQNATCDESSGSVVCTCNTGYSGDGASCSDIDECITDNGGCAQTCENSVGSFTCSCNSGFELNEDGLNCDDIDECLVDNGGCGDNATCSNNTGAAPDCSCNSGYHMEDNHCVSNSKEVACIDAAPTNGTSTLSDVTVTWDGTAWSTAANCAWNCDATYHTEDSLTCISDSKKVACIDAAPTNGVSTVSDVTVTWDGSAWSTAANCSWICDATHHTEDNTTCIGNTKLTSCTDAAPTNGVSTLTDVQVNWVGNAWEVAAACSWSCVADYHTEDNTSCISNSKQVACIDAAPTNGTSTLSDVTVTWDGSAWSTAANCTWSCDATYHTEDSTTCIGDSKQVSCIDAAPTNGTSTVSDVTVTWDGSAWPIAANCDWVCDADYHTEDSTTCIGNTKLISCTDVAPTNGTSTITDVQVNWVNDAWEVATQCNWNCNSDYHTEDNLTCVSDSKEVACNDVAPTNGVSTVSDVIITWDGTQWSSAADCSWSCESDYHQIDQSCHGDLVISSCSVQHPIPSYSGVTGRNETVFGRVVADGITGSGTENLSLKSELCYSKNSDLSDPVCVSAMVNSTCSGCNADQDEYQFDLSFTDADTYYYFYRFSGDAGANWRNCDVDGSDIFDPAKAGVATIIVSQSCEANSCNSHGTCADGTGLVVCSCTDAGYTGDYCDQCDSGYHMETGSCVLDSKQISCTDVAPTNGVSTVSDVTVTWDGTAWSTAANCAWSCDATYHTEDSLTCISDSKQISCTDAAPTNGVSTVSDVTVTWDGTVWSTAANCAWSCDSGFHTEDSTTCIGNSKQVSCIDAAPTNGTSTVSDVTVTWDGSAWPIAANCAWSCDATYHTEDSLTCISDSKQVSCTDVAPTNGVSTVSDVTVTWDGTAWSTAANCAWSCDATYHTEDSLTCISDSKQVSCTDAAPTNGASIISDVTITWDGSAWSTAANCAWSCDSGFHTEDSTTCIGNSKQVSCIDVAPTNGTSTVSDVTVIWDGSAWSTAANCAWSCDATYHTEDSTTCISDSKQVSCTDAAPTNGTSTVSDVTITWNGSAWSTAANCAWSCDAMYHTEDSLTCIGNSKLAPCVDAAPTNGTSVNADVTINWVSNAWETAANCNWNCDTDFHTEDSLTCISDTRTGSCSNTLPTNSDWDGAYTGGALTQTWNGSLWLPADSSCTWSCDADFHTEDSLTCTSDTKMVACTDAAPTNGISTVENVAVNWVGNAWETAANCNWTCDTDYHTEDSITCISDSKDVPCNDVSPTNGTSNIVNVEVTWDGSSWSTASDCSWSCDGGYHNLVGGCAVDLTVGWCNIQDPKTYTEGTGTPKTVYGQVYIDGVTTENIANSSVNAQLCWSASSDLSDPTCSDATFNVKSDSNHEYQSDLTFPTDGIYYYYYQFSGDAGNSYVKCDQGGTDYQNSDTFAPTEAGVATIYVENCTHGATRSISCDLLNTNNNGTQAQTCNLGTWENDGTCNDPDVCTNTTTQAGTTPCGFNSNGKLDQLCGGGQWADSATCVNADVCTNGDTQAGTTACGFNSNGKLDQLCGGGQWADSATCVNADVCTNGDTQAGTTVCGFNGNGKLDQLCSGGQWADSATCVNADVCTNGDTQAGTTVCGFNSNGKLDQLCSGGQWADNATCVNVDVCTNGDTQAGTTACGFNSNGKLDQLCSGGQWADNATCVNVDVCTNGDTQAGTTPCGFNSNGKLDQLCGGGQWADSTTCVNVDVCTNGDTQAGTTACGFNSNGKLDQLCGGGQWADNATCVNVDVCTNGDTQAGTTPCGFNSNGKLDQLCGGGQWADNATCVNVDVCTNGDTQAGTTACGFNSNGKLDQLCSGGQWADSTTCVNADVCTNGDTQAGTTPCGFNSNGKLDQLCGGGQWADSTTCDDPDICENGTTQNGSTVCGLNSEGVLVQTCTSGAWVDGATCTGSDICTNTDTRNTTACGNGTQPEVCTSGAWVNDGACNCNSGWNGATCSTDVDECLTANGGCDANATCTNTAGSRTCACNADYSGDGVTCTHNDDCSPDPCQNGGACTDGVDSYTCDCTGTGYSGATCGTDVDECLTANGGCDANATCTNTAGSRTCACNAGYAGDGLTCSDINECALDTDGCNPDEYCSNTVGSFTCTACGCDDTFTVDSSKACTDEVGQCDCSTGYAGLDCTSCATGYQDNDTDQFCEPTCATAINAGLNCGSNGTCDDTLGLAICDCDTGFSGTECDECSSGYWGASCTACPGTCDTGDGNGMCNEGDIDATSACYCSDNFVEIDGACVGSVVINEVDPNSNWVELYNRTESSISLEGWTLDANTGTGLVTFIAGDQIAANGYYMVYTFDMNAAGDYLSLDDGTEYIDEVDFSTISIASGKSYGRFPNASDTVMSLDIPTQNSENKVDIGWCATQFPDSTTTDINVETESIYGQVYTAGITDTKTTSVNMIEAELCYSSDLTGLTNPVCKKTTWDSTQGNNHQYLITLTLATGGAYKYFYKFSGDGGNSWTTCNLNSESGSDTALNATKVGDLTVDDTATTAVAWDASSVETFHDPELAFDGNLGTRWASLDSFPAWITSDLGSQKIVRKVVLEWEAAATTFKLQGSNDNSNWSDITETLTGTSNNSIQTVEFTPNVNYRYIRMYAFETRGTLGVSLYEFEVYTTESDLFFSEYVEGNAYNKALEIYNPTSAAVDLSDYAVKYYTNSGGIADLNFVLSGCATTIPANGTIVIVHPDADDAGLFAKATCLNVVSRFNGNDTLTLTRVGTNLRLDIIGETGLNYPASPVIPWSVAGVADAGVEHTLVRKTMVLRGNPVAQASFGTDAANSEWIIYPQNTITDLGSHGEAFLTTWKTDNTGISGDNQITIPTTGTGYNYNIDCNHDGTFEATNQTGNYTCTYASAGTYQVAITGTFPQIYFNNSGDKDKIISIDQWGKGVWRSMENAFYGCTHLGGQAVDTPDLSNVTNMRGTFASSPFNQNISNWDVSNVTDMFYLFNRTTAFNQDLSSWDVSNVTNMNNLFAYNPVFNQDLSSWTVSSVTNMRGMFWQATSFNGNISTWNVGSVINMQDMFGGAITFNQNISGWDVSKAINMRGVFYAATAFNQNISGWTVSSAQDMSYIFQNATSFNQDLSGWNVSSVTNSTDFDSGATAWKPSNKPVF